MESYFILNNLSQFANFISFYFLFLSNGINFDELMNEFEMQPLFNENAFPLQIRKLFKTEDMADFIYLCLDIISLRLIFEK